MIVKIGHQSGTCLVTDWCLIYTWFDTIRPVIGLDKIKHIKSYSANSISKFTNEEIQRVIDHFTKNPNMEFTDDFENVEQDNEFLEEPNQIN